MGSAGFPRWAWASLAAAVVGLAAGGDRAVYASSAGDPGKACSVSSAAAPLAITLDATLTGTVMVDAGRSLALFDTTVGIGLMHEGEAFADGTLLCEVRPDRIVVGRAGSSREVFLGEKGQPTVVASPRLVTRPGPEAATATPVPGSGNAWLDLTNGGKHAASPAGLAGLRDFRAANFHAMLERRSAQPAVQ